MDSELEGTYGIVGPLRPDGMPVSFLETHHIKPALPLKRGTLGFWGPEAAKH